MLVTTELQGMFSYSIKPIILILFILILLLFISFIKIKSQKYRPPVIVKPKNVNQIKIEYLEEIDKLSLDVKNAKINNRKAYQKLSTIIRKFIFEVTGIKVQNYTLEEIKNVNIPILHTLVEEYYHPEFAHESSEDVLLSIAKTREVIQKWK